MGGKPVPACTHDCEVGCALAKPDTDNANKVAVATAVKAPFVEARLPLLRAVSLTATQVPVTGLNRLV